MQNAYTKINKENYDRYVNMKYGDLLKEIEPTIPIEWKCGYGWYGCRPLERDGEYFLVHNIGSSCD